MPLFLFKCPLCGADGIDAVGRWDEVKERMERGELFCPDCGGQLVRDFKAENAKNTFHPSKSLRSWFSSTGKPPKED